MSTEAVVDYLDESLARFVDDARAQRPTPGGGSVSALVGVLGVALGEMAARYSPGPQAAAGGAEAVARLVGRLERSGEALRRLVDEDIAAYEAYSAARKETDASRAAAARVAALVPLEIVAFCTAAVDVMAELKTPCNRRLLSDLHGGAILAEAAARAAAEYVGVNLPDVEEPSRTEFANQLESSLEQAKRGLAQVLKE